MTKQNTHFSSLWKLSVSMSMLVLRRRTVFFCEKLRYVFCHAKRHRTIYSAGFNSYHRPLSMHSYIDHQKVLLIIFSRNKSPVSLLHDEKKTSLSQSLHHQKEELTLTLRQTIFISYSTRDSTILLRAHCSLRKYPFTQNNFGDALVCWWLTTCGGGSMGERLS